jgi:hypothetical protein
MQIVREKRCKMCINGISEGMDHMAKKSDHASKKASKAFGDALKKSAGGNRQGTWLWTDFVKALEELSNSMKK